MIHLIALAITLISWAASCGAMVYDNRYFPLIEKPIYRREETQLFFRAQPFVFFAHAAYDTEGDCDDTRGGSGLFEVTGMYDENLMDYSLLAAGRASHLLLPASLANDWLPWRLNGNLTAAGVAFQWYWSISRWLEVGGSFFFMGDRNEVEMSVSNSVKTVPVGVTLQQLYDVNQQILLADGIKEQIWKRVGISDLDLYIRFGILKKFLNVFRTFDFGASLGMYAPTSKRQDLNNPASMPFGGDGHWGLYGDINTFVEFKEDMFFGLQFRGIGRFKATHNMRVPVDVSVPLIQKSQYQYTDPLTERLMTATKSELQYTHGMVQPNQYGSLTIPVAVSPGFTFVFSPYVALHGLRGGFGVELAYNMTIHTHDHFVPHQNVELVATQKLVDRSSWNKEYLSFSAMYDFGYDKENPGASPRIYFDVDVPVAFTVGKKAPKTFGISLRIESDLW